MNRFYGREKSLKVQAAVEWPGGYLEWHFFCLLQAIGSRYEKQLHFKRKVVRYETN